MSDLSVFLYGPEKDERGDRCLEVIEDLKNCNKAVGIKQSLKAVANGNAKVVFIAKDADEKITGSLKELCRTNGIQIEYVDTMKQLGKAVGIEVGASAACVLREEV